MIKQNQKFLCRNSHENTAISLSEDRCTLISKIQHTEEEKITSEFDD